MTDNTFFAHVTSMLRHNEMMLQAEEDLRVSAEKITDDQLTKLSVNELNRYLQQLPRNERLKLKRRRRVVKNRGYASRARKKRVTQKVGLELEVSELQNEVCKLQLENDIVRMELSALRNKFAILQNVMEMNHLPVDLLSAPVDLSARAGNTQQQSDDVNCFPLNMPEPLRQSRHSHCPTVTNRANEIIDNKCSFTSHDAVETDATSSSDGQKYLKRKHDSESFSRSKKCLLRFNLPKETTELENSPSFERFSTAMPYSSKDSSLISNEAVRYVELEDNRTSTDMSRSGDGMIVHRQTTRITRSLSEHSTCRNTDDVMLPQHVPLCELENTVQADGDSMHSTDQVSNTQHGNTLMLKSSERHFSMITVNGLVHAEKSGIQRIGQATDSTDETIAYSDDDEDDDDESVRDSETESEDELDRPLITENQLDILYRPTDPLQCAQHETCIHNQQTKLQAECTHKQPLDVGIHISPSSSNTLSPPVAHSIKPTVEGQCFDTITVRQTQHEPSDMPSWLTVYERNDIATNIATNCGISDNMKKRHVVCSEKPLNIANFPACVIKTTESKRLDRLDTVPMPLQESLKIVPITSQSIDNKLKEVDSNDKAISYAVPPGTFRSVSSDSGISCSSSFECDHSDDMPLNMTKGLVSDVSPGCTGHQEADKGVSVNKCSEDAVTIPIMHRKLTNRGTNLKTFGLLYVSLFFRNKCLCVQCLHCKQMMQPLTFLTHHDDVPEDFEILKQDSMEKYSIEYVGKLSEIQWSLWVRFIECLTAQLRTEGFTFIKPEDSESITLPSLSGNVNQCTDSSDSFVEHQNIVDYSRRGIVTSDLTSKSCTRVGLLSPTKITDNQMYMHHSISSGSVMSASECSAGTSRLVASRCHSDTFNDAIDLTSSNSVKAPSSVIGSISRTVSNSEERMTKNRHDDGLMENSSDSTALFIDTTHNGSILSDAKNTSATEYCNSRASSANSDHDYALNRPYSSIYDLLTTNTRPRFKAVDVSPTRNTFTSRNGGVRTRARSLVDRVRSDRNREKRSQYHRAQSNSGFTGNECPASSSQHLSNEAVLASEVPRQLDEHQSELAQYKGGRPKDPIWKHFLEVKINGKQMAKCRECEYTVVNKVARMKIHYEKSTESPVEQADTDSADTHISKDIKILKLDKPSAAPCTERLREELPSQSAPPSPTCPVQFSIQTDLSRHCITTTSAMKSAIDIEVARLFYACNLPFSMAEHPQFVKVVSMLRQGYKPPSRKLIGGKLLDAVHDQVTEDMKVILDGKTATLVEDGWSNIHNEPIIASCLQVEGKSFFLNSFDTGSMTKSAENCKVKCQETIQYAKTKYNCTVKSIVTDNAKNMERMRDGLKADDNDLIVYGCSAYWLNLLGQDITPDMLIKHVVEIQKYFRNHHKPLSWLSECIGSVKPQLPCDTRWKSQLVCIDSFIHNRPHFMKIVQDHEGEIDNSIVKKIMDFNLFRNARDLAEQLRPISIAIDTCQSDTSTLADACHVWLELLNNTLLEPHKKTLLARFSKAILSEHLVAYTLHPKFQGEMLVAKQFEEVNNWIIAKNPSFIATFIAYQAKSIPFPASYFCDAAVQVPSVTWWKALKTLGVPGDFIDMAIQLLEAPASSASSERILSNFGYIHTKIRNRLGVEKASKVVFCYRMLRGLSDLDY